MADKGSKPEGIRRIAENRKAYFNYLVDEDLEAGVVLQGTEVKSLRDGKVQLTDAYASIERGEVWLQQLHVSIYPQGSVWNHEPLRRRKLLLHKTEIERLTRKVEEKGYTLIPLELYFKQGRVKVKLGLCRGKKQYDKRASIKARDIERENSGRHD